MQIERLLKMAFENDPVEVTKDKYLLTFNPLMPGGKKGHRCLNKNLQVKFAGLCSAYDLFYHQTLTG